MRGGRRFQFQLTPLLDLLLIVIFAQYLDVKQQADVKSVRVEQQLIERQAALEAANAQQRAALAAQREELAAARGQIQQENAELRGRVADVVEQQRRAANIMAEIFAVPPELVDEALKPLPADAPPRTPADVERLRRRFKELANLRGQSVIEHLLTYEELRKRADVWSVRIDASGELLLSAGDRSQRFRAGTPNQFADRLYERYKTLPTPKGLVILLVSYGDARADIRQAVLLGLPEAIRQMRDDQLGRTQFEYAVLGFVPSSAGPPAP